MIDLEREVIGFVSTHCRIKQDGLRLDTRLNRDVGLAGDDGVEFLESFAQTFNVEMTGCDPKVYFGAEGLDIVGAISEVISKHRLPTLEPLTIAMLVEVARRKQWKEGG